MIPDSREATRVHRSRQAIAPLLAAAVAAAAFAGVAGAQPVPEVPVMVGAMEDMDACLTLGQVGRLDPAGDNFLAVRSGPGASHGEIDRLHQGDLVNMCEQRGRWIGIVYEPADRIDDGVGDCGVGTPITPHQAYPGPCRSGWVFEDYILGVAG